jgi:hypothetical protein
MATQFLTMSVSQGVQRKSPSISLAPLEDHEPTDNFVAPSGAMDRRTSAPRRSSLGNARPAISRPTLASQLGRMRRKTSKEVVR